MGGFLWTGLIGLVGGVVAKLLLRGRSGPLGLLATALLGICGSSVGSFLGQLFGFYESGEYAGIGGSIVGAALLLLLWSLTFHKKAQQGLPKNPYHVAFLLEVAFPPWHKAVHG
jgi:uncharacterized membrane protein YeaQ/YmgE (transglycosylase-associated protein family)